MSQYGKTGYVRIVLGEYDTTDITPADSKMVINIPKEVIGEKFRLVAEVHWAEGHKKEGEA